MPATPILISAVLLAVGLPMLMWALTTRSVVERRAMLENLQRELERSRSGTALDLRLAPSSRGALSTRLLPRRLVSGVDKLHARAGRPASWPIERLLSIKLLLVPVATLAGYLFFRSAPSVTRLLLALAISAFIFFVPEMLLASFAARRREQIALKLPDMMDQLSIAVEAGLGFESALGHVAKNTSGALSEEIVRTLQDIQVGVPRRVAYEALSDRVALPELRRFIRAIIQAEQHGISVARVLNIQASEMRIRRRLRAEEKAMRIPVLVAFPLFLFIFPALLVVVLGPAIINIIEAFTGGLVGGR